MNVSTFCKLSSLGLCANLLALPPSPGEARDGPERSRVNAAIDVAAAVAPQARPNFVHLADGFLSVKAHDVALVELLQKLSQQARFQVVPCMEPQQRVSVEFHRLPLEQGLMIILRDQSFVLRWKTTAPGHRAAPVMPQTLWILPQRDERTSVRLATAGSGREGAGWAEIDPHAARLLAALRNGSSEDREQAAADLGQRRHASAIAPLAQSLTDSDEEVRRAAIDSLAEIGGDSAAAALAVALRDSDPRVREAAVNALGDIGGPMAIALLQQAQGDATTFVARAAAETLEELNLAVMGNDAAAPRPNRGNSN